jgi:SAM-dependent methyltransferase
MTSSKDFQKHTDRAMMRRGIRSLFNLAWGYRAAKVLQVANSIGIFTKLSEKEMSLEEVCQHCHTEPVMTEKLLIACIAMGLLCKNDKRYKNTNLAEQFLVQGKSSYQGDIIAHSAAVWDFWNELEEKVRIPGAPMNKRSDKHRAFILGMHNIAANGRTKMFLDKIDLSGRRRILDVGAGPGTYSIMACKRYPALNAVLFDLPETISIAQEIIAQEKMQDRVKVKKGNWEKDDFGEGFDVVLLFNVLHGPDDNTNMKLKKANESLEHGGLLVIQEFLLNDEKTGPLESAFFNIMLGAYSHCELLSLIKERGFVQVNVITEPQEIGFAWITAEKP